MIYFPFTVFLSLDLQSAPETLNGTIAKHTILHMFFNFFIQTLKITNVCKF